MTQKFDYSHDVYDYLYQVEPSGDVWEFDELEQYIWDDLEDEFESWLNEEYGTPANLLRTLQNVTNRSRYFDVNEWYTDTLCEFENYVLEHLDEFGIYLTLKEDEEGE